MATAVGTYATPANLKTRLGIPDANDDTILGRFCDWTNSWIEGRTGRVLVPGSLISTTVASGGGAGSSSVTLGSGTGVSIGDALMFGPVTGTHEHAIVAGVAGAVMALQSPLVNAYSNGTAVTRALILDGDEVLENGRCLPIVSGLVTVTSVEAAFYTGGAFFTVPSTDWFLRPNPIDREPGWPATEVWMTDVPSSSSPMTIFARGMGNIRLGGAQPGWPAMPDEIVGIAEKIVANAWRLKGSGAGNVAGPDYMETAVRTALDGADWRTMARYTAKEVEIV